MWPDIKAELIVHSRRPANWMLWGIALLLTVTFGYLIPYLGLNSTSREGPRAGTPLSDLLPANFALTALGGMPLFIGALVAIFGVLTVGSDYGWDTWKTVLVQTPSRTRVLAAKGAVLLLGVVMTVVGMLVVSALSSIVVASLKDRSIVWPGIGDLVQATGSGLLILSMWAAAGAAMAIVMRSIAIPVGLTLVWMLVIQNLITGVAAPVLSFFADLDKFLPGPVAGSLVANLGGSATDPGVVSVVSTTHAIVVLVAYLVGFTGLARWVFVRRDLT